MERKLATIRKIKDLQPIEGADKIEVAEIAILLSHNNQ